MKINNRVNFLKQYFLITTTKRLISIYPTIMQIECKFVVDLCCLRINNFRNNKYPQKPANRNNSNFMW